jgi:hypothetical protein
VRNLKRKLSILTAGGQDSIRFYLLRFIARRVMPNYRLRWHSLAWWDDADFNAYLAHFGETGSLNIDRRWAIHQLLRLVSDVPGDTAECGVYLGATSYLIAKANQQTVGFPRKHFLFDSFAGLSEPNASDGRYWRKGDLSAGEEIVRENLRDCENIVFMKGWIPERFDEVADRTFAFVHIDVDLYEPTRQAIEFFYPRLNDGGIMALDDLGFTTCPGVERAINEALGNIAGQLIALPDGGGFLIKGRSVARAATLSGSQAER